MVHSYMHRQGLASEDLRFIFEVGDLVLMRQKRPGKMKVRAVGPYRFAQYHGVRRATATVVCPRRGKEYRVSVANLVPIRSASLKARLQRVLEVLPQLPQLRILRSRVLPATLPVE